MTTHELLVIIVLSMRERCSDMVLSSISVKYQTNVGLRTVSLRFLFYYVEVISWQERRLRFLKSWGDVHMTSETKRN